MCPHSELAALSRPRVAVLDTTFAHHSWDFEPQVRLSHPQPSLTAGHRGRTSINAFCLQLRAAAALADCVSIRGPPVVIVTDM